MSRPFYNYIGDAWARPKDTYVGELLWERMQTWRRERASVRVSRPTRLDRARRLGYRAKQGIIVVRTRIRRGGRRKSRYVRGRRTKRMGQYRITPRKSLQRIAEERTARKYPNMEVLNSYWVGSDGKRKWYEVILVDPAHPAIRADPQFKWLKNPSNRGRVFRGKTSAGKKGRGLRKRGIGSEKATVR
ncbi:MAG: Ribosomal protein L15e [Candidatus Syntrophoarchaeum caldarius]|uniref:Large ribosomal subunit protein eL15 n=1 Tax=Candidatus Syntropharchaeum caldarium TaxID=1838285 RepID=A0A1F2PC19_9EURY|nr:MAG: Ribosomal protein L15e [Candidatus Syntrophoarchaeum caldarius]